MNPVSTVGLDLAKHIFQLHGADSAGAVVFRQKLRRGQLLAFLATLPPCTVALEACASAHSYVRLQGFWAKQFSSGPCRSVLGDGIQLHGMGDGALRRRSIKLLSAGWLPHSVFRLGASPVQGRA